MLKAALIFSLVCRVMLAGQSQPPSPAPSKTAKDNKGHANDKQTVGNGDKRDPDPLLRSIEKLISEIASWKDQQAAHESEKNASPDWWTRASTVVTAIATLAIAGLGIFQWRVMHKQRLTMDQQSSYMRDALVETKKAADAARLSADVTKASLEASVAPELSVKQITKIQEVFQIELRNYGRYVAFVADAKISFAPLGQEFRPSGNGLPEFAIPAGSLFNIVVGPLGKYMNASELKKVDLDGYFIIKIELTYRDVLDNLHFTEITGEFAPKYGTTGAFIGKQFSSHRINSPAETGTDQGRWISKDQH